MYGDGDDDDDDKDWRTQRKSMQLLVHSSPEWQEKRTQFADRDY